MSNNLIRVEIRDQEVIAKLKKLAEKTSNMRPVMRKISAAMHHSVEENFRTEGARLGQRWADLANSTKNKRAKIGKWPGKILQRQGSLISSISAHYDDNEAKVGTNKVYAAIHQFGGEINMPARERTMFFKKYSRGKNAGKTLISKEKIASYGMKTSGKSYSINMPARPFMGLNDDDLNKILGIIQDELEDI